MKTYKLETTQEVRATLLVTLTIQADSPEEAIECFRDRSNDDVTMNTVIESVNSVMYDSLDDYDALYQIEEVL